MNILFLIRHLGYGGAQRQLITLANQLVQRGHQVSIIVFYPNGELESCVDPRISLLSLAKQRRWDFLQPFLTLVRHIREIHPDLLHSYMMTPNLLAILIKPLFPGLPVIWGKRDAYKDLSVYDAFSRFSYWLEPKLSRFVDGIIINSSSGRDLAVNKGFPEGKIRVIYNGIDTQLFHVDPEAGRKLRLAWNVSPEERLVGVVGRFDPIKDHPNFVRAANLLHQVYPYLRFACIGSGSETATQTLFDLVESMGLKQRFIFSGMQADMPAVYNALDVLVSTSYGEGFSNVIAEAMACGVPCIATDVGDSARITGPTGQLIPPKDPESLAKAVRFLLDHLDTINHQQIRQQIVDNFSVDLLVSKTEAFFLKYIKSKLL